MVDIGVPDFNVGYNSSQGSFHNIGNSGNIHHRNQFDPAFNVERGLNQMRLGESITSGNLAYQNAMVSEGIRNSGRYGSPEGWYFGVKFDNSGSVSFENRTAAYDYMWEKSFHNGQPIREVSGWELQNGGTIVMPYNKNENTLSYNNYLKLRKSDGIYHVKFGNNWYPVSTHVHTHPQMYLSPSPYDPGFSKDDINMNYFIGVPIHVIYNRRVFQSDFYNGRWNILNFWKW